jgi:hypothetical protein
MSSKLIANGVAGILLVSALTGCSAVAAHQHTVFNHVLHVIETPSDPISGDWNVTFHVHENRVPATITFKLDGTNVTGTVYSDHTGPGTIRAGKWADGKLSFTVDFQKHESIVVRGELKDGKLVGEFSTEGFTETWEAVKK